MTELEQFEKCTTSTIVNGRISLKCKLGLWEVEANDSDRVYLEAFHYWRQYKNDGEYYRLIGGESPKDKLKLEKENV